MNAVIQAITLAMGLTLTPDPNPNNPQPPTNYYGARIAWQQRGQPRPDIEEDVAFIRAVEVDDEYNRIRDVSYEVTDDVYTKITNYTRVWEASWYVYGPNSFDNCRKIRTRLFDQDIHDQFAASQLYLVTDPSAPQRVPEQENGQWWERVDFSARFNEEVTETYETQPVEIVSVIVETSLGQPVATIPIQES
jgi:hypothetical protein